MPERPRHEADARSKPVMADHDRALAEALALHEQGALQAVIPRYRALLAAAPGEPRLWLNLGAAIQGLGRLNEAMAAYQEAVRHGPGLVEAQFNLGCALADLGRTDDAVRHFAAAIGVRPGFAPAHYNLANALRRLGKAEAAVGAYRDALALTPGHAESHNGLGLALRELGDIPGAEAAFLRALELNPTSSAAFANLATVHRFGPHDPMLGLARTMEERRVGLPPPAQIEIAYALGKVYDDLGDPALAMARLAEGAALRQERRPYDEAGEIRLIEAIKAALTPEQLSRMPEGCP